MAEISSSRSQSAINDRARASFPSGLRKLSEIDLSPKQQRLVVIADDLTGATDTGLQFCKVGLRTAVYFDTPLSPGHCDVAAITTESRSCSADEARRRLTEAGERVRSWNAKHIYKKIDSTMRGNIGAEVEALSIALDRSLAVLTPAFPASGRTVRDGRLRVNGLSLAEGEFADDPLSPQRHSRVAKILAEQSNWRIVEIGMEQVRSGVEPLTELFEGLAATKTPTVAIVDAVDPDDLAHIANAVARMDYVLPAGSAGLAEWFPAPLQLRPSPTSSIPQPCSVDLAVVVVGSVNPVARRQLERLARSGGVAPVTLAAEKLVDPNARPREIERGALETSSALASHRDVALTFDLKYGSDRLISLAEQSGLAMLELTEVLVGSLGVVVASACASVSRVGLVLTGGDTAIAVCRALGGTGLVVSRELAPGIPICTLVGGGYDGAPVVTKAGGFGTEDALMVGLRTLKGGAVR